MRTAFACQVAGWVVLSVACGIATGASAAAKTIRVVTYNIQSDISGVTTPRPGLITPSSGGSVTNGGVLEGIGEEILAGNFQPIDILALQETTSNSTTVQPIVNGLNAFYSAHGIPAGYAMSTYQATESGGFTGGGNGPNALVYNTNTVQLVASVPVDPPGGTSNLGSISGMYREVMRYEFAPAGVTPTTNNEFYVYVSHYKSGTSSGDITDRNGEAQIIRANAATLPSSARILYTGDFNASNSSEAMYQTLVAVGTNQGFDPLNPSGATGLNWGSSTTVTSVLAALSESATNLRYRDDYQMMSSNVFYSVAGGLAFVPGTYHVFGINGTTPYNGNVNSGSNTSLNGNLTTNVTGITATQLYQYLTTASDHLPAVVDYTIAVSDPSSPQSIQTVFVIPMENMNWSSIRGSGSAPYINNTLLPMASHAEQYYNPPSLHPSLPNYLWLEAGTNFGITSDLLPTSAHQSTTNHLVTLLKNAGISWRSYDEDICGCLCPLVNTNSYVPRHNPFVYFDDVTNTNNANSAYCIANVRAYSQLAGDITSNTVARYNWIVPNLCDDMHNSCSPLNNQLLQGDTWLSSNLPAILNSQAYSNNGAIFIVWDEGAGSSSDGPIGMIVLSPLAKGGGYSNTIHYTHSSTILTMQEIFNITPLLGGAANATDLSDLFVFGAQLAVSPATAFDASGQIGGPFNPNNQTYTLSNTGGVAMVWSASKTVNWLDLSATSGTLAPAASTNIIASINANANALPASVYSDTIAFATSNGSGNATRPVSLTVNNPSAQLVVSPASAFNAGGPPGGPFSPISQTYGVSNSGGASMSWTANSTANWLTLSATGGTLPPGASTNVLAVINTNASSLAIGNYSDTIGFTNTTNGAGNTTRGVNLNVSTFGFFDDFSTFASGNLVGQSSWTELGVISNVPIQVVGGQAGFTGGLTVNAQTAYKNFGVTNETVFYGMTLTVTNAPNTNAVPYFATLYTSTNGTGTAGFRLAAESPNAAKTNFVLGVRINPAPTDPYTFGTTGLSYGTQYRVIVQAVAGGTNVIVYVNPTSANLDDQTPYAKNIVTNGALLSVGSIAISQLDSGTIPSAGGLIGKVAVGDNFGTVYNDLLGALPPSASFAASPTNGIAPLTVTFADTSSGTITNWFWDYGDGNPTNITTNTVAHTYAAAGTFSVTEIVSGPDGSDTNTQSNLIVVLDPFSAWQLQYFSCTNCPEALADADPLGKGMSNTNQFLAGLNPTNPASLFQITSIMTDSNNNVLITWSTAGVRTNAVQATSGDASGGYSNNFQDISGSIVITVIGDTTTNSIDINGATNFPNRYYRVRLVP